CPAPAPASVAPGPLCPKGDGEDNTLWNVENLRFCVGNDAVTGKCNSFYDVPTSPLTPIAAPAVALSASSLTFSVPDAVVTQALTVTNVGTAPLEVTRAETNDLQ